VQLVTGRLAQERHNVTILFNAQSMCRTLTHCKFAFLVNCLAALAYRTQKTLRDAP
jgi:hypothetical protein